MSSIALNFDAAAIAKVEKVKRLGEHGLEKISDPQETLYEIITNAMIRRDYSIADDIHSPDLGTNQKADGFGFRPPQLRPGREMF